MAKVKAKPPDDSLTDLHLGDKYTVAQFQELAKNVSKTSTSTNRAIKLDKYKFDQARAKVKNLISPRQEIYKSMLREIRSTDTPPMNSLVHKASGILRLEHYKLANKNQKVVVSWDIDGRRVLTYEGKGGVSTTALGRETEFEKPSKKKLLSSLNEPIFGLDFQNFKKVSKDYDENGNINGSADCERLRSPISKSWLDYIDSGDSSKLWDSKEEAIIPKSARRHRKRNSSRASDSSETSYSKVSTDGWAGGAKPPRWKSSFVKPSRERIKSWESTKTLWGTPHSSSTIDQSSHEESNKTKSRRHSHAALSSRYNNNNMDEEEKVDRVQHICVVNGSVVSFKDFAFENFTNWFGDEAVLEANQQRCQPKFHLELDLANIANKDVKIRMLDGYKLEIDARRRIEGSKKPLRVKEYLHIPKGYQAEDLLLCRTKTGKLIVEELTSEPLDLPSASTSKTKLPKRKGSMKHLAKTDSKRLSTPSAYFRH